MEFKVEGSRRNKQLIEGLLPSMIRQLKLENSKKSLLIRVYNECNHDEAGATFDFGSMTGCYLVIIRPRRNLAEMALTLAHEMVHVKQMAKGTLKSLPKNANLWAGKKYSNRTKYLDRPWEIEAFARQELLLRRAIDSKG